MNRYIDMHCDTLSVAMLGNQKTITHMEGTMLDIERLKAGGAMAQFFAMFLPQHAERIFSEMDHVPTLEEQLREMHIIFMETLLANQDSLRFACCHDDIIKNLSEGYISALLTIENGCLIENDLENLKRFHDLGVRLITLTWNDPNCLGQNHSSDPELMQRGLTPFGKEAVACMNDLGILVDVSHLSDGGFYDVAAVSKKPFVASHSNCRALSPATRNLTDDMIRILAEHGGVAGLNFCPQFLNPDITDTNSRIDLMCEHVTHMARVGGVESIAIGTDFDGIDGNLEIAECTQMELLFDALRKRGFKEDVMDKFLYSNVLRVIKEVC